MKVAERLGKEPKLNAVYSSDLKRAFDTAQMIAQSCGVLKVMRIVPCLINVFVKD